MRITIVGLAGSGKTTLADTISKKLNIPHIEIDRFWFDAGGRQGSNDTPNIEAVRVHVKERVQHAIQAPSWVSDGFYSHIQPEIAQFADSIVFLDVSLWQRIYNHLWRTLFGVNNHKELSLWDNCRFLYQVIRRTFTTGPKLRHFVSEHKNKVIALRSRGDINKYVQALQPSSPPRSPFSSIQIPK